MKAAFAFLAALAAAMTAQPAWAQTASSFDKSSGGSGQAYPARTVRIIVHVPYKGDTPALTDTVAGHVEMLFSGVPALLPHIKPL